MRELRVCLMRLLLENGLARNGYSAFEFLDAVIWANDPDLLRALSELKIQFVSGDLKGHLGPLQAVAYGCFRMVEPLVEFGCRRPGPSDRDHMFVPKPFVAAYDDWCENQGLVPVFDSGNTGKKPAA